MADTMFYAGGGLDRAALRRRDAGWVAGQMGGEGARIVPVWRDRNLVRAGDPPAVAVLTGAQATRMLEAADEAVLLGLEGDAAYVAIDLTGGAEPAPDDLPAGTVFEDLRMNGALMDRRQGSLLAYARGMVHWHRNHRFCGACGGPTESREAGHLRHCASCGRQHFPRTDPAVIMLVTGPGAGPGAGPGPGADGEACLLARQSKWPEGIYSTLAGFVEPGESLEEAVAREVLEETGIETAEVRYMASQPWPFPASLMLGFRARAVSREISFDTHELEDAGWFTRDELRSLPDRGRRLPRPDSIARWLVDGWIEEGG